MRKVLLLLVTLGAAMSLPGIAAAQEEPNTTCSINGAVAQAVLHAEVRCLQLDTETYGEFDASVTARIQKLVGGTWTEVAAKTCTGGSAQGVMELPCSVTAPMPAGQNELRGLIDLDAPKNWGPVVAQPTYLGGRPILAPLAEDECDLRENIDADLTASDAPWADLCAVTMSSQVGAEGGLEAVNILTHVTGLLGERTETTNWVAELTMQSGCTHRISVADAGVTGTASARIDTGCGAYTPGPCGGVEKVITDLTNGSCSSAGSYATRSEVVLPRDAVTFTGAEVIVTLRPEVLEPSLAREFALGQTVRSVRAFTTTGIGSGADRASLDYDTAESTQRRYTIGD